MHIFSYGKDPKYHKIIKPSIIEHVVDEMEATQKIKQKKLQFRKKNDFVNFISVETEIETCNIMVGTLYSMINQKTNRQQLLKDLK